LVEAGNDLFGALGLDAFAIGCLHRRGRVQHNHKGVDLLGIRLGIHLHRLIGFRRQRLFAGTARQRADQSQTQNGYRQMSFHVSALSFSVRCQITLSQKKKSNEIGSGMLLTRH
jgi:hypothetical protein